MLKRFKKVVVPFAISSAILLGLAGCGTTSTESGKSTTENGPITLKVAWWGSQDRHNRTLKVIQMFEDKYPNVKIQAEYTNFNDYWTKMATEAAGNNLPDVMQMDYAYIGEYSARKLIEPLDSYVSSGKLNLKDVDDAYLVGGRINNKLYAVNLGTNAPAVAYDPGVLDKYGASTLKEGYTYDDLINDARQLKAKAGSKDFYPIDTTFDFGYYLREKGATLYNKDGNVLGYDNDQYLTDFFTMESSLVKEGLMAPPQVTKAIKSDQDTLLVKGNAAFRPFTSNLILGLNQYAKRPIKISPLPVIQGGQEGNYLKPAMFFSVSSSSKQKEMAAKFIDFFTNDLAANDVLLGERGVPISSAVRDHLKQKLTDADKENFNYIEYVVKHSRPIDPPAPKGASKVTDLFGRLSDQVLYGQLNPADAAKQFRVEANKILSTNK